MCLKCLEQWLAYHRGVGEKKTLLRSDLSLIWMASKEHPVPHRRGCCLVCRAGWWVGVAVTRWTWRFPCALHNKAQSPMPLLCLLTSHFRLGHRKFSASAAWLGLGKRGSEIGGMEVGGWGTWGQGQQMREGWAPHSGMLGGEGFNLSRSGGRKGCQLPSDPIIPV